MNDCVSGRDVLLMPNPVTSMDFLIIKGMDNTKYPAIAILGKVIPGANC